MRARAREVDRIERLPRGPRVSAHARGGARSARDGGPEPRADVDRIGPVPMHGDPGGAPSSERSVERARARDEDRVRRVLVEELLPAGRGLEQALVPLQRARNVRRLVTAVEADADGGVELP